MRAAIRLFAARGFQAIGIRELADAVGLSSAALYHYMGTKEDLLVRIMSEALQAWYDVARDACDEVDQAPEKLCAFIRAHVISSGLSTLESVVIDTEIRSLSSARRVEIIGLRDRYEGLLDEALLLGLRQEVFQIPDTRLLRLGLLEMCNGLSRWYQPSGRAPIEQIADSFADIALAAARARRGRRQLSVSDMKLPSCSLLLAQVRERAARVDFLDPGAG
jgi:AcrR family transcriptional regulator